MGVEAFGFDQSLADQAESALSAMFARVVEGGLSDSGRRGEDEQLAVGKDAVHIEEKKLDLLGAGSGRGCSGHRAILAFAKNQRGIPALDVWRGSRAGWRTFCETYAFRVR